MDVRAGISVSATALDQKIREHLSAVSSDHESSKKVKYSFHVPVEIKKEISLIKKMAFDEMLHVDLHVICDLLRLKAKQLQDELQKQKDETQKRSAFKDFSLKLDHFIKTLDQFDSLDAVYQYLMSSENSITEFLHASVKLREAFESYVRPVKIDKQTKLLCDDFIDVYFDGFYQYIGVHYRLHLLRNIQNIEDPTENALVEYEVKEVNGELQQIQMAKKRISALNEIAKLDPDESLPLVLFKLRSILRMMEQMPSDAEIEKNLTFLREGIVTIFEGEQKQRVQSVTEILGLAASFDKNKFKRSMEALVDGVKEVKITNETCHLWEDAALLFEGLHLRFYRFHLASATKIINNVVRLNYESRSSMIDGAFHSLTGFYRINIGEIYYSAAKNIQARIADYRKSQHVAPVQSIQVEIGVTVEELPGLNLVKVTTIAPRVDGFSIAAKNKRSLLEISQYKYDSVMQDDLNIKSDVREDIRDDLKIIKLADVLDKYQLQEHHIAKLHFLDMTINSEFAEYVNSGGGWSRLGYERMHAHLVQEKLGQIQKLSHPTALLKLLIEFRAQLKTLNSVSILAKVEKILLLSHSQLMDSLQPKSKLIKRSSKANVLLFQPASAAASSSSARPVDESVSSKAKKRENK